MSDDNSISRRNVIRAAGVLLGGGGMMSGPGYAKPTNGPNTEFRPNSLSEVKQFAEEIFDNSQRPFQQLQRWAETGEKNHIFKKLSVDQKEAFLDSIRPSIFVSESVVQQPRKKKSRGMPPTNTLAENCNSQTVKAVIDENNPIEKWGWDADIVREDIKNNSVVSASEENSNPSATLEETKSGRASYPRRESETHSEHVYARAVSLDWKAYEFTGYLHWDYNFSSTDNPNTETLIGYTNGTTWHEDTEVEVSNQDYFVQANWQVTFKNGIRKICAPVVKWPCIEMASKFQPYMALKGYSNGSGETLDKGDDALDGDFILN